MATRAKSRERKHVEYEQRSVVKTPFFRLGRLILGGVLAFMAVDNFRQLEGRVEYAEAKGTPMANISVPLMSGLLFLGSLGMMFWRFPMIAAGAVSSFFVSVTPVMHDFWNRDDPQEKQQEMINFLKNTALLGATFAMIGLGRRTRD